jgi:hypothetical protein
MLLEGSFFHWVGVGMDTEYSKHVSDIVGCVTNHIWLSRKREHVNKSSSSVQ